MEPITTEEGPASEDTIEGMSYENIGLRGIKVATTRISDIDGRRGRLYYRGYSVEVLAKYCSFEEVAYLLINGELPTLRELEGFDYKMRSERAIPDPVIDILRLLPSNMSPMAVLQLSLPALEGFCPDLGKRSEEAKRRKGIRIIAKMPTIVAAWDRLRSGLEPQEPDTDLDHASSFLYMLKGSRPNEKRAKMLDKSLILHAEHSFNASTFTARVVASTRTSMYAAISAAVGSLSGELHGGANTRVMQNLLRIGTVDKVEEWVKEQFDQGKRVSGLGHAVYRTLDPRAKILAEMVQEISDEEGEKWFSMAKKMAEVTQREFKKRKGRNIYPNVDLYSAPFYYQLGIPIDLFTPVFAIARSAGWVAHVLEEKFPQPPMKPMLYRPSATYVGKYCGGEGNFVPIEQRG